MLAMSNTFKKPERLCLKKLIDRLFDDGRWLRSNHLRFVYLEVDDALPSFAQVLFTAPKKIHRTAVKRNLIKRRMRESYRTHKALVYDPLNAMNKKMILAFVYNSESIAEFSIIDKEIKHLLSQLNTRITGATKNITAS
jgi:ribonuclease P protein component